MGGIRYWIRSFGGMIMFCAGFGGMMTMLALADYYASPILLLFAVASAALGVSGRLVEKRAERAFIVDRTVTRN